MYRAPASSNGATGFLMLIFLLWGALYISGCTDTPSDLGPKLHHQLHDGAGGTVVTGVRNRMSDIEYHPGRVPPLILGQLENPLPGRVDAPGECKTSGLVRGAVGG